MPQIIRQPLRMDCTGADLTHPVDRQSPGGFPYLLNVRSIEDGSIEARPGYTVYDSSADAPLLLHSIRRLNKQSTNAYTDVVGNGTILEAGVQNALVQIDTGYSGKPLSLIPFRPDQSPEAWMYVYDSAKSAKVRTDGTVRPIGVAPPTRAPDIDYGIPAMAVITEGQSTAGWGFAGVATAIGSFDRTNASVPTINSIAYNSGTTGWCCINPVITQPFWMGERMRVILNSGGGNQETVAVREIHNAITTTTIASIAYDVGTSGLCSIVLTGSPVGLTRNSLIRIAAAETVRVLEVISTPDGTGYSIRCSTASTRAAGNAVTGLISWYVYTTLTHVATETISVLAISVSQPALGAGSATLTSAVNASIANGRPVDTSNDYLHISIFLQNPQFVVDLKLLLSLDGTPNFSFTNPGNTWIYTITAAQLNNQGSSGNSWGEVVIPLSSGVRSGNDLTRTLANITGIALQLTSSAACAWGFDDWYLFGTYGPLIQPNSPSGIVYQSRFRDLTTGNASVPGPQNRYEVFPLREAVIVTPQATNVAGIDEIDIYRQGGLVTTSLYVGSVANNFASPNSFTDGAPDSQVLQTNQPPDLTLLQPWPILDAPWTGTVNVVGTSVTWVSGMKFNTALLSNTVITISGLAYQTFGQPVDTEHLQLTKSAGTQSAVAYSIASPTLAGQPLPVAFGPLEGPFLPVVGAVGDPLNAGTFYFSNQANLDSASDQNTLELCSPSEPLIGGEAWNGQFYVGSRENVYAIRYTFAGAGQTPYQFVRLPSPAGFWSRWAICRGPDGVYALGADGIYTWTDQGGISITDERLNSLFPQDGQPADGAFGFLPIDMTQVDFMRLSTADFSIYFDYIDSAGDQKTWRYEIQQKRWFPHAYADEVSYHYYNEPLAATPNDMEILTLSRTLGLIYIAGGDTDNGTDIDSVVWTPSADGGDERMQKLYVDAMTDASGVGSLTAAVWFDDNVTSGPSVALAYTGARQQKLENIASLGNLASYRNISIRYSWTGGPSGIKLYASEPSGYAQPYLSDRIVTQVIDLSFPGWKFHRRMYPALISNAAVRFIIKTQDGRTYSYVIPSTGGLFRVLPQMLDQDIKDLAFGYELDGDGTYFALFPESFVIETKEWTEASFIRMAVFKA